VFLINKKRFIRFSTEETKENYKVDFRKEIRMYKDFDSLYRVSKIIKKEIKQRFLTK